MTPTLSELCPLKRTLPDARVSFSIATPPYIGSNTLLVHVYNDITCHLNDHLVTVEECLAGDKSYGSYELRCDF